MTAASLAMMGPPSCRQRIAPHGRCVDFAEPLPADIGFPLALGALGAVVLGSVLWSSASERSVASKVAVPTLVTPPEESPDEPTVLDEAQAVGMVVAQWVVVGFRANGRPARLLDVDDSHVVLHVEAAHAELSNLRVRTAAHPGWRVIGACFAYERDEWRLTTLGATPGCR